MYYCEKIFLYVINKKFELMLTRHAKPIAVPVHKLSDLLQPFCRSSFLECVLQPKIAKINEKTLFRKLRSFKVIDVDTTEKLVTSAFCNR